MTSQRGTNKNIIRHLVQDQLQGHYQGQVPDLLIKRKSGPDVLNRRFVGTNVILRPVQNHSQDLVQDQGHIELRKGQRKQKEDHISILILIQTLR